MDDTKDYQQLRQQLDQTVSKLQDPECDVDQAVTLYEQALQLIDELETYLEQAENKVTKLQADFAANADVAE